MTDTIVPRPVSDANSPLVQAGFVEGGSESSDLVSQVDIDAKLNEVTEDATLDEATKREALDRLKGATEWLKAVNEAREKP